MRSLRNFMVVGLLLIAAACSGTGQVASLPDNPENRMAAAKKCIEAMPPKDMLQGLSNRVAPNMPEKDRKAFLEVMGSPDLEKETSRIMEEGLAKNFTVGELTAMTAFYGSPEGKSAAKKFGPYMAGVMPQIQQEIKKRLDEKQKQEGSKDQPGSAGPKASPAPPAPTAPKPPVAPQTSPAPQAPAAPKVAPAPPAPVAPQAPPASQAPKEAPSKK